MMHVRRFLKEYRQAIPHWPELRSWRHNAIHIILIVLAVAGLPAWGAVVVGAVRSGEVTPLIGLYAAVYLALLALALLPRIDPRWRIWGLLVLGYVNGAASLLRLGLEGSGRLYLLAVPLFTTVLVGTRAGLATALLSLGGYTFFILQAPPEAAGAWLEAGLAFAVFVICTVLLVGRFSQFQMQTLGREQQARRELEAAQAQLETYNRTLEARVLERTAELDAARRQAEAYAQRLEQEMQFAGRIQASFMGSSLPQIPSWECAAALLPARETSGDFYDVFALPDGRYGVLIGDVVDKGVGAALFMALCWALLHTYARQYPDDPARVLAATNARILRDTHGDQFVTLFYGVLDPRTDTLRYANAGHHPPYHLRDGNLTALMRTGIPLGILEEAQWREKSISFQPRDICLLYTDGVTEAQNSAGDFFERARLAALLRRNAGRSAEEIRGVVLGELAQFTGEADPHDDVTLVVMTHTHFAR